MLLNVRRVARPTMGAAFALYVLFAHPVSRPAFAQTAGESSNATVEGLIRRMDAMQQELDDLRGQSAESQAFAPTSDSQIRVAGLSEGVSGPSHGTSGCPQCGVAGNCGCCQGSACGCYPCECGQCPAPCIACPHVSTLNPYFNVSIYGGLKFDAVVSDARAVSPGTPYYLLPGSPVGLSQDTSDFHARQSSLGAVLTGPQIGDFQAGGRLLAFFYNDNAFADAYGILPMQAWGDLRNDDWRFAAGYQFDVFNPAGPTILPFSGLCGSGNSGNAARGQVRLERFVYPREDAQWTLQLALSEPISSVINPDFRISEDNGWPNIEGRIALGLGYLDGAGAAAQRPLEVGVSGVVGELRNTVPDVNNLTINRFEADVWGVGGDFRWRMNEFFGVMGEVYTGEGLGTYNGAALQLVNPENNFQGIESTGGWCEFFVYWTPCHHSHFGYGIDDPRDADVPLAANLLGRVENSTVYGNIIYDVTQSFRVAFEVSWRETEFRNPIVPDNDGMFFHTQFAWNF